MTRDEAEARRRQLADAEPDVTWLVAGSDEAGWRVVKVGLEPERDDRVETTEQRPRPPYPDDNRTGEKRNAGGYLG